MKYVYNDFGQLITEYQQDTDGDGTWDLIQSRTSNKVNEITDITETVGNSWTTPSYNKSGNMTTIPIPDDPTSSYTATYDAWNRLVKLEDDTNTITEYQYDGTRRRVLHKVYNTGVLDYTKHLYYNANWQLLEERRDANTSPTKQQIWGNRYIDDLVLRDHDNNNDGTLNERLYALQDANWNVTSYANENGTIQERYIYNAYGSVTFLDNNFNVVSSTTLEPDHLYAGYNYDSDVELYHVRNRVYHPVLGCWLQRDPIGNDAGDMNLYEYISSRVTTGIDFFGLFNICGVVDRLLANPQVDNLLHCLCGNIGIADILPSASGSQSIIARLTRLLGLLDCLCNIWQVYQTACECRKGGVFDRIMISIGQGVGTAFDCALEFMPVTSFTSAFANALLEVILASPWEMLAQAKAAQQPGGAGKLPGIFRC